MQGARGRLSLLAVAGLTIACSSHNVRGNALEVRRDTAGTGARTRAIVTGPITAGDFEYRATSSGLRSRWPPVMVQVTVTVTNVSTHPATLDALNGNCAVRVRIYPGTAVTRGAARVLADPVFDAAQRGFECYVPLLHVTLAPGKAVSLQSAGDGPGVTLAPGPYHVTGVVTIVPPADSLRRHGPDLVEVSAGTIRVPPPYD